MKKVLVAALAAFLAVAISVPASAFESEFGGYWRTRAYTNQDFSGDDKEGLDTQLVDTRTRLYYTAKFSDDFKFVNKFEFDAVWGDSSSYGAVGADAVKVEVKNSYVDYTLGNVNFKIGAQGTAIARGFVFDDDFSGVAVTGKFGEVEVPFYWMKITEGGMGKDKNDIDKDAIIVSPVIKSGEMSINPFLVYVMQSEDKSLGVKDYNAYDLGLNFDIALGAANFWTTLVYQGGSLEDAGVDYDMSSYLVAFGGDANLGALNLHGQMFYASGDDKNDKDIEAFADILSHTGDEFIDDGAGQSYYWAEIMGYGTFDKQVSNGSCADKISNIMAFNIGASMSPMEKLTVGADIWYASLAEDDVNGEDYLGTELDLSASYKVMDNLTLDVIAAYLFAGDATGEEDPMEVGAQLSFKF